MKKVNIEMIKVVLEGPGGTRTFERPAFEWKGVMICDPTLSECDRFEVDPAEYYGLDEETIEMFEEANIWC